MFKKNCLVEECEVDALLLRVEEVEPGNDGER